jgi:hypothetical protein
MTRAPHWDRGRLARTERRQARMILEKAQLATRCSRFALAAGETPAVPVKSLCD